MLQMGVDTFPHRSKTLARLARYGRADTCKIVITWPNATCEIQVIGLQKHVEECVVPPYRDTFPLVALNTFAYRVVKRCYVLKSWIDFSRRSQFMITVCHKFHEAFWCHAL